MRRVPPSVWILAPLALGIVYAILWPRLAPRPTLTDVVPADAVLTHRFRDLAAMNAHWLLPSRGAQGTPSEREAARRNLAGLPGVDPHRPFHLVLLERGQRPDPTMMVFPVADADRIRARFEDPTFFLEKGWVRHAQHLVVRGEFAAVAGDRDAARRLGEGGITAEPLGEDHAIAVRVPALLRYALAVPFEPPWSEILPALGFDATLAAPVPGAAEGELAVPAGRVLRVHDAWRTARLWSWHEAGRIRAELEPAPGRLADALAAVAGTARRAPPAVPSAPPSAQAWFRVPGARERVALAWALYDAGVPFPEALATDPDEPLGAWGRVGEAEDAGLLLWAAGSPGTGYAWTLGLAAPAGALPPLAPFHPAFPTGPGEASAEAGTLPLTVADLQSQRQAPPARIVRRLVDGLDVVVAGAAADDALTRFTAHLTPGGPPDGTEPPPPPWRRLATFRLIEARARTLLGPLVANGGLLSALAGGDIEGVLLTDGRILRLEARVVRV